MTVQYLCMESDILVQTSIESEYGMCGAEGAAEQVDVMHGEDTPRGAPRGETTRSLEEQHTPGGPWTDADDTFGGELNTSALISKYMRATTETVSPNGEIVRE